MQNVLVGIPMGGVVPNDLPLNLVEPARLESLAPFPMPGIVAAEDRADVGPLLLEATVNAQGQVVFYKILSGPDKFRLCNGKSIKCCCFRNSARS